mgnify:CR=1 FL=1
MSIRNSDKIKYVLDVGRGPQSMSLDKEIMEKIKISLSEQKKII